MCLLFLCVSAPLWLTGCAGSKADKAFRSQVSDITVGAEVDDSSHSGDDVSVKGDIDFKLRDPSKDGARAIAESGLRIADRKETAPQPIVIIDGIVQPPTRFFPSSFILHPSSFPMAGTAARARMASTPRAVNFNTNRNGAGHDLGGARPARFSEWPQRTQRALGFFEAEPSVSSVISVAKPFAASLGVSSGQLSGASNAAATDSFSEKEVAAFK